MPFTQDNAASVGSKGGISRWRGNDPTKKRSKPLYVKVTETEFDEINEKALRHNITRVDLIIRAVRAYEGRTEGE